MLLLNNAQLSYKTNLKKFIFFTLMNMALENFTYHYRPLSLNDTQYNSYCYVKEGADLKNTTSFVYSEDLCKLGFVLTLLMSICGTTLNALIVITLFKNKSIRKERFTPIVISLASCNFLFSIIVLPIKSSRLYHRFSFKPNFFHHWYSLNWITFIIA